MEMKCEKCGNENTKVIQKSMNRFLMFVVHCNDCGEDRLPTPTERDNFNG